MVIDDLDEVLHIGIVQTTIDAELAWPKSTTIPLMSSPQEEFAWHEISRGMRSFLDGEQKPKIIIFPELSIPRSRLKEFEALVCAINSIVIAGLDYNCDLNKHEVKNQGMVFVPNGFWDGSQSFHCEKIIFGKSHPAPAERGKLGQLCPAWSFVGDHNVYLLEGGNLGRIGISICYDFMDIERALIYRGKIHHLFVIAYNRDTKIFQSLAECLSRTIFCNVVVCNTGRYGGSIIVSPYHESENRIIYSHGGLRLYTTQVARLPVRDLKRKLDGVSTIQKLKDPPPGISDPIGYVVEKVIL